MTTRDICVISTNRADLGALAPLLASLAREPEIHVSFVVSGPHATDTTELRRLPVPVTATLPYRSAIGGVADNADSLTNSISVFSEHFALSSPDIVFATGDRCEMFGAVTAAYLARIPIAHLAGGDITQGSLDDGYRHAVTKFASLHFATNPDSASRLIAMGEQPSRVHVTGSPALDRLLAMEWRSGGRLPRELIGTLGEDFIVVTFHPETTTGMTAERQATEFIGALANVPEDLGLLITGTNDDPGAEPIRNAFANLVSERSNALYVESLGSDLYWNALLQARAVVGNSSSGIYEAPALGVTTVDVGTRQQGRVRAGSVIHAPLREADILMAIALATRGDRPSPSSLYGDGSASQRITTALREVSLDELNQPKVFYDLKAGETHG